MKSALVVLPANPALTAGGLADALSRPKRPGVSAILAASDSRFRELALARLSAAGCHDLAVAEDPAALDQLLRGPEQPMVVVGGHRDAVQPFLRVAVKAGAIPVVLLDPAFSSADATVSENEAFAMGARGALHADLASPSLAAALAAIDAGLMVVEPGARVARPASAAHELTEAARPQRPLTNREREILGLVAAGTSNKGIARVLSVSANTVKFHLGAVFEKLDAVTRAEAVAEAIRRGELSI